MPLSLGDRLGPYEILAPIGACGMGVEREACAIATLLPLDQTLKYAGEICDALDTSHKKNITHRDLKPANILGRGPSLSI